MRLSDEALSAILERYGRRQAVELILVCSHFNMVSRILESTRVEVEPENLLDEVEDAVVAFSRGFSEDGDVLPKPEARSLLHVLA